MKKVLPGKTFTDRNELLHRGGPVKHQFNRWNQFIRIVSIKHLNLHHTQLYLKNRAPATGVSKKDYAAQGGIINTSQLNPNASSHSALRKPLVYSLFRLRHSGAPSPNVV